MVAGLVAVGPWIEEAATEALAPLERGVTEVNPFQLQFELQTNRGRADYYARSFAGENAKEARVVEGFT